MGEHGTPSKKELTMDWQEVEETRAAFRTQAERVGEAGPYGAADQLGRMLDYVNDTSLLKDYIESCPLGIPEAQVAEHLQEVLIAMGTKPLDFGRSNEDEIARLWRMLLLMRNDIGAIRQLGYCLSLVNNGDVMIEAFGKKVVLRFYEDVAMHFRHHKNDFLSAESKERKIGPSAEDGLPEQGGNCLVPTVFISYSRDDHQELVRSIVDRLISNGVNAIFDEYDLRYGHDVNKFMERTVNDPKMSKVLIMCDRSYVEKADKRRGGVGKETIIISQEVYSQSSPGKFIPVVLERDEHGEAYRPVYLRGANYIDLSDASSFEEKYRELVCEVYGKPFRKKPPLGNPPDYVTDRELTTQHSALEDVLHQMQQAQHDTKRCAKLFLDSVDFCIAALDKIAPGTDGNVSECDMMALTLPIRNYCLQITRTSFEAGAITAEDIGDAIEKIHAGVSPLKGRASYFDGDFAYLDAFFHELFICLSSLLLEREEYGSLHDFLWRTYFLRASWFDHQRPEPCQYTAFRKTVPGRSPNLSHPEFHGSSATNGTGLFETHELKPYWTTPKIQKADLFLFQMSEFKNSDSETHAEIWLPVTATHYGDFPRMGWDRLVSKRHCRRMLPLFGLKSIEELKTALEKTASASKRQHWNTQAYEWVLGTIPDITREILPGEIGSME